MSGIPPFLLEAGEYGPDVPREFVANLGGADKDIKFLCSAKQKVGFSAEPGFKVSVFTSWVVVALGTKCGFNRDAGLGSFDFTRLLEAVSLMFYFWCRLLLIKTVSLPPSLRACRSNWMLSAKMLMACNAFAMV